MYDITIVAVPYTIVEVPPLAPAVLKGAVESQGFKCYTLDLGLELFKYCNRDRKWFNNIQKYFTAPDSVDSLVAEHVNKFLDQWVDKLVNLETRWLGFSVFSHYNYLVTYTLCKKIKQHNPNIKIVVGGPAVAKQSIPSVSKLFNFSSAEQLLGFGDILKKRNLVDKVIAGDGEQALIDLLNDNPINAEFNITDYSTTDLAFANFDNYHLGEYTGHLNRGYCQIPIFTSKGCVRDCDFCDVNTTQHRFRFRQGKNIAAEMIYLADRYNIRDFVMLDNLINGNLKNLREWVGELASYNLQNPSKRITWSAAGWICRPIGQVPVEFYKTLADSGCDSVTIGAESGSNSVLDAMNKKTNVEALYFEVEQMRKNNIKFTVLVMIGHWSETWSDFIQTCNMLYRLSEYTRTGHFIAVNPGLTFALIDQTPADLGRESNGIISLSSGVWWSTTNPTLTPKERYFRLLLCNRLIHQLKIPTMQELGMGLYQKISNELDLIKQLSSSVSLEEGPAAYYWKDYDSFVKLVTDQIDNIDIQLDLTSSVTNNTPPELTIEFNHATVWEGELPEGTHSIKLSNLQSSSDGNSLKIKFTNKAPNDTIVDAQGNIVKDKFVAFDRFIINNIDLFSDHEFFYKKISYRKDGVTTSVDPGFWFNNSELYLEFQVPFLLWYNENTDHYAQLSGRITTEAALPDSSTSTINEHNEATEMVVSILKSIPA